MGTKVAPTYATFVLGFLEEKLNKNLEDQFSVEFKTSIQQTWKRFLDDCFITWTKTKDELNMFYNILNNLNNHLKFTIDCSEQKLPFLDVMIIKREDIIITDIYYKPTDTKQYLVYDSCHPKHIKNNIPYNLARRLCTIISD